MAEFRWATICTRAVVDKFSNTLSILEVLDEITAEPVQEMPDPVPADARVPTKMQLLSLWARSDREVPETAWCRYSIVTPDGEEHPIDVRQEIDMRNHRRARLIAGLRSINFRGAGSYLFKLYRAADEMEEGELVGTVPLEIKVKPFRSEDVPSES